MIERELRSTAGGVVLGVLGVVAGVPDAHARGGEVLRELPCPVAEPMGLGSDGASLWISDLTTRTIVQLSKADGTVLARLDAGGLSPTGLAWHQGTLFVADRALDSIARRRSGEPDRSPIPYYEQWATGLAHDGAHLWVVDSQKKKLHQIDPDDGTTIKSFDAPAGGPTGVAVDGNYLWVADHVEDELHMVDPTDGSVLVLLPAPGPYPSALAADGDGLWVADYQTRKLSLVKRPDETPYLEDKERLVHASYEVLYRVSGEGSVEELTTYLALPRDIPGQHLLGELSFEPRPTRLATDRWGQRVAVFELGRVPAGETRTVRWEGDLALYRTRFHIVPERVGTAKPQGELADYLGDDKKYDLRSPVVGELVDKLTKSEKGSYHQARALYEHLAKTIRYDRSGGWNNAAAVLERGTGSCSEYTFALVALLRRAGIPARYVGAISERGDEASFDDVFHRWAEAYLPGYGWVPLDANAGHGGNPRERASFFGGRSNRHVVTTIGGGASDLLEWSYNSHETYRTTPKAKLEVRPLARYRPLATDARVEPSEAPKVLAPRLTDAVGAEGPTAGQGAPAASRWWYAVVAALLGFAVGAGVSRRSRTKRKGAPPRSADPRAG
jgi:transglutaminase-like putative cysteine protease